MWFSLSLFVCSLLCVPCSPPARKPGTLRRSPVLPRRLFWEVARRDLPGVRAFCGSPRTPAAPLTAYLAGNLAPRCAAHAVKIGWRACRGGYSAEVPSPHRAAYLAGNLAPRCAAHAAKIGLTGLTAPLATRESPHPPPPRTLLFSLLALAVFALQLTCRDNFAAFFLTTSRIIVVLS